MIHAHGNTFFPMHTISLLLFALRSIFSTIWRSPFHIFFILCPIKAPISSSYTFPCAPDALLIALHKMLSVHSMPSSHWMSPLSNFQLFHFLPPSLYPFSAFGITILSESFIYPLFFVHSFIHYLSLFSLQWLTLHQIHTSSCSLFACAASCFNHHLSFCLLCHS